MGRRLPWKTSATPSSGGGSRSIMLGSPRDAPRVHAASASPSASFAKKPRRDRVVDAKELVRSPSTSPPPEPPPERFMRPGPQLDDRFRMVEDEFLNTAHQFTTHLHRAEYNRLKSLAKSQNAAAIREIERPVVGTPTLFARQRQDSARRIAKQRKVLPNGADGSTDDTPFVGTSLQGLMESPRKEAKWISTGMAGAAATRASAGLGSQKISPIRMRATPLASSSSRKRQLVAIVDDDETDDGGGLDLATPTRKPATKSTRTVQTSSPDAPRSATRPSYSTPRVLTTTTNNTPSTKRHAASSTRPETPHVRKEARHHDAHDDDDDDDPFGINKRRIQRQKSKEQLRKVEQRPPAKKSCLDDIPSFI